MIIEELICKTNGTQAIEQRELPDNFFTQQTEQPTETEKLRADVDYLAIMTGVTL